MLESVLIALVTAAGVFALAARFGRLLALTLAIAAAVAAAIGLARIAPPLAPEVSNRPIAVEDDGYVTSRTCKACHPHEYDTWYGSFHRTMTQVATPESVVAPFEGVFQLYGDEYRLERQGDEFQVERRSRTLSDARSRVVMTTGSHHMQAYWVESGYGRLVTALPLLWLIPEQQWIPRASAFLAPTSRASATGPLWNTTCIRCHSTHGRQRRSGNEGYDTKVAELGISCEACHGPAEEHVRANRAPARRYALYLGGEDDPTVVQPERLTARPSTQVCGQCHGIHYFYNDEDIEAWNEKGYPFRPGDELTDSQLVVRHTPSLGGSEMEEILFAYPQYDKKDRFWSDGMVRVSGRDMNGMIESPCYQEGGEYTCLSCHTMHKSSRDPRSIAEWANDQLAPGMDGDEACLQCHDKYREDLTKHTFHKPESTGSRCYNCHMSHTVYGLLGAIRSHQIDNPTVQLSLETGRPNACNQCHLDQTLAWTADYLEKWYETPSPELTADERNVAASVLWTLRGDAGQRALMAWSLGWDAAQEASGTEWMPPYLGRLLVDDYDAVRLVAARSLRTLDGFEELELNVFVPPAERSSLFGTVLDRWRGQGREVNPETAPALLIGPGKAVLEEPIARLLDERDIRAVILKE